MTRRTSRLAVLLAPVLLLAGCGGDPDPEAGTSSSSADGASTEAAAGLDSMVAMGASSITGYGSGSSGGEAPLNSWATGSNPAVQSLYLRLLKTHPALADHGYNLGVAGSTVDDLVSQAEAALAVEPLPDVVVIQAIDNDIQCDGTDPDNYAPFAETLDQVLTTLETGAPGVRLFLVDQWGTVQNYADAISELPEAKGDNSGDGPCDFFTQDGAPRPDGVAYLQDVVDHYFAQVVEVCSRHDGCSTDGEALKGLSIVASDLTPDSSHLQVGALAQEAELAWAALPDEIKELG